MIRYSADITAGSFKLPESRLVADLLLRELDNRAWRNAIVAENILRANNPATAIRVAKLIRARLETMGPELWRMVKDENGSLATHALLAAAVKHSHLLGDFLKLVVKEQFRIFSKKLSKQMWNDYLESCRERDSNMPIWSESTRRRLRSSVFHMLAQAGYVENTRSLKIQTVHVAPKVLEYLRANNERYVLDCIQVAA